LSWNRNATPPFWGELTDGEASALGVLVNRLARILKEGTNAEHVYGFVYGDAVKHLHVHLVPRYPDTPREYWGARVNQWPSAPRVNEPQMREFVAGLRARL
jgi:diadenosine tetraphosphate (Ap4A) HIT family hydrolase